jgi:mono/diheme cytochrome c family protein
MNRRVIAITLAILMVLVVATKPAWASEGHVEEEIPAEFTTLTNPQQITKESIKIGWDLYARNCAGCHGDTGKGDGPLANALPESPTDFTEVRLMEGHTDGELFFKTKEGVGDYMPAYEGQLTEDELWHLVNYLRSIAVSDVAAEEHTPADTAEAVPLKVRPEAAALKNPVPNDHIAFTAGEETYGLYCYRCHGENGQGNNGSYAKSVLKESPLDLSNSLLLTERTDGELFYSIKFGSSEMPSHQEFLTDEEIWQTVNYIRTFEGQEHPTMQGRSNSTFYGAVLLIVVVLIAYAIRRR